MTGAAQPGRGLKEKNTAHLGQAETGWTVKYYVLMETALSTTTVRPSAGLSEGGLASGQANKETEIEI